MIAAAVQSVTGLTEQGASSPSCSTTPPCATASRRPAWPSPPRRRSRSPARWRAPASPRSRPARPPWGAEEISAIRAIVEADLPLTTIGWCRMRIGRRRCGDRGRRLHGQCVDPGLRRADRGQARRQPRQRAGAWSSAWSAMRASKGLEVAVGGEDSSRADVDFLIELIAAAKAAGARRFRIADTLSVLDPDVVLRADRRAARDHRSRTRVPRP